MLLSWLSKIRWHCLPSLDSPQWQLTCRVLRSNKPTPTHLTNSSTEFEPSRQTALAGARRRLGQRPGPVLREVQAPQSGRSRRRCSRRRKGESKAGADGAWIHGLGEGKLANTRPTLFIEFKPKIPARLDASGTTHPEGEARLSRIMRPHLAAQFRLRFLLRSPLVPTRSHPK